MKKPASGWSDLGHPVIVSELGHPVPGSEKDHPVPRSDFGHPVQAIFHLWLKGYRMMIEKLALDQCDHCFPGRFLGSCIATQNLVWAAQSAQLLCPPTMRSLTMESQVPPLQQMPC